MKRIAPPQRQWILAVATAVATPLAGVHVGRTLPKWGALDIRNHRSSHRVPTLCSDGVAALLSAAVATFVPSRRPKVEHVAAASLAGLGLAEEVSGHVRVSTRSATQLVVSGAALSQGGCDRPLSSVATPELVNAVNFMDGISGITATPWRNNALPFEGDRAGHLTPPTALTAGASHTPLTQVERHHYLAKPTGGTSTMGSQVRSSHILSQSCYMLQRLSS